MSISGNEIVIAWPTSHLNYVLEITEDLAPPIVWSQISETPVVAGEQTMVTSTVGAGNKFYRLRGP